MITLNPLILRVQVMLYPFFTIMLNPSNTSMGMCFLETTAAYMKLWVAPPSIRTVTLFPPMTPQRWKVMNLGVADKLATFPL